MVFSRIISTGLLIVVFTLGACSKEQLRGELPPSSVDEAIANTNFEPPAKNQQSSPRQLPLRAPQNPVAQPEIYHGNSPVKSRGAEVVRSQGGVEIYFDGADIREVVKVILSDILGKSYTIDPAISGEVILSSAGPVPEDELLILLETALQMQGATLVANDNSFSVVVLGDATGSTQTEVIGGGSVPIASPGLGFTVVPLKYLSAEGAAQFIQPILSQPEHIRVDTGANLLLFAGTAFERQNVLDTLADIDVDWMAGRSVGLFPLQRSAPETVIIELEALFDPVSGSSFGGDTIRFIPVDRLNAILAIASGPSQITNVQRWVNRLDRGMGSGTQFFVHQLNHVPAEEIAKLLNESFSDDSGGDEQASLFETDFSQAPSGDEAFESNDFTEPGFDNSSGGQTLSSSIHKVKIVANPLNNSLLIRATARDYEQIVATLNQIDTPPLQVLIEATIAEVTLTNQLRYGVQYFLNTGSVRGGFNTSTITDNGLATGSLLEPLGRLPGFNFILTPGNANITIDALSRLTDVKILSSPSLVVQDNSEASLNVGDEVPITTRSATNVETINNDTSTVVNNIEYRDTGVILDVKPRISSNDIVSMDISQEVSRVATETVATADNLTPTIQQRKITSSVNILSGQTVVLGGLIQDSETRGNNKVPGLGDVPVLGNLFRSTDNTNVRTELIVFITPKIIANEQDARDVSNELRAKMRSARPALPRPANSNEIKDEIEKEVDELLPNDISQSNITTGNGSVTSSNVKPLEAAAAEELPATATAVAVAPAVTKNSSISEPSASVLPEQSSQLSTVVPIAKPDPIPDIVNNEIVETIPGSTDLADQSETSDQSHFQLEFTRAVPESNVSPQPAPAQKNSGFFRLSTP